jgi:hypothetical protein
MLSSARMMPPHPYKRTASRKRNVRDPRGVKNPKKEPKFSWTKEINLTGKDLGQVWWDSENWSAYGMTERPENVVWVKKPSHLKFVPPESIVFVDCPPTKGMSFSWAYDGISLLPPPTSLEGFEYVTKNPKWTLMKENFRSWSEISAIFHITQTPEPVKFMPGYVIFERPSFERYKKAGFIGKYMFGNCPDLRFSATQLYVGAEVLIHIVNGIKNGKKIYRKEIKRLRMKV